MPGCRTPEKSRYATREAAESAARRARLGVGKHLSPYDECGCGWWHLTSGPVRPVEPPSGIEEIAAMDDDAFEELTFREIRNRVHDVERDGLRSPVLVRRWEAALRAARTNLDGQFARHADQLDEAAEDWRQRVAYLRTTAADRLAEAQQIITGVEPRPAASGQPVGSKAARRALDDEHLDTVVGNGPSTHVGQKDLRRAAGEAAIDRLIDAHREEFGAYLIQECRRLGAIVPDRVLRHHPAELEESV